MIIQLPRKQQKICNLKHRSFTKHQLQTPTKKVLSSHITVIIQRTDATLHDTKLNFPAKSPSHNPLP